MNDRIRVPPDYRIRLFQSVDLVGSTAFKARNSVAAAGELSPLWVTQIRHFYREFPKILSSNFGRLRAADAKCSTENAPAVWKTVGDEIIFCTKLNSLEHLSLCTNAFIESMEEYGQILEKEERALDVKGSSWTAVFPSPNITVDLRLAINDSDTPTSISDQIDDGDELSADKHPHRFDFLGPQIDAGFRSAKLSSADSYTVSMELALLLAKACQAKIMNVDFIYNNRHVLKGVLNSRPYPLISLDVERSEKRRKVVNYERALTKAGQANAQQISDFLDAFFEDEGVDKPILPRAGEKIAQQDLPKDYQKFKAAWDNIALENKKREEEEAKAGSAESDGNQELPESVTGILLGEKAGQNG